MLLRVGVPRTRQFAVVVAVAASALLSLIASKGILSTQPISTGARESGKVDFSHLPLQFEALSAQGDSKARFLARTPGVALQFTESEVVLSVAAPNTSGKPESKADQVKTIAAGENYITLRPQQADTTPTTVLHLHFLGANSATQLHSSLRLPGTVSYFRGNNPAEWQTGLPTYAGVTYEALYPGIALQYNGTATQLKGTYILAPGADTTQIHWRYDVAQPPTIDNQGNLLISLNSLRGSQSSVLTEAAPVAWQEIGGEKLNVQVSYVVAADGSVGFSLGAYDHSHPLVIDPTLTYSSYLGNPFSDGIYAIAVDSTGNIYVTGTNQPDPYTLGDLSVYKINADASAILYTAILVGNDSDVGYGIAVDATGNAYVTGESYSTDFPLVNPFQTTNCYANVANDAVVLKLNPAGTSLVYSTYLGGCGGETGRGVAVDATGSVYVTGDTGSTDFPVQNAFQGQRAGPKDAFVTKFSPSGTSLDYSTYLGGGALNDIAEYGWDIEVDGAGSAYVTGYTGETDFPLHNPIQASNAGFGDSYLTKFSPSGTSLVYSTYLGGNLNDIANDVALDASGDAYVAGWTESTDFPTVNPYQATNHGYEDVFVTKVNPAGSAWLYSTYLGGIGRDGQYNVNLGVAADGSMIVAGDTQSSDFPVGNWIQQFHANPTYPDIFVTDIAPSGAELLYSTFLGGNVPDNFVGYPIDVAYGLDLDANGKAYITGQTNSPNWPIAGDPFQPNYGGGAYDALVAKIDPNPPGPPIPPAPTPGACATTDYVIGQATGTQIVSGTVDIGNHCDFIGCTTGINLPFPFTLYDRTFTSAYIGSAGTIGFVGNQGYAISRCLPLDDPQNLNFGIMAYWDYIETDGDGCTGGPCGIYTSVSGSAPNRIFNIEWRARKYRSFQNYDPVNFEVRLYENSTNFDVIYGAISNDGADATFGVQRDTGSRYTQFACQTAGSINPGLKLSYTLPPCGTPQPSATPSSPTATHTPASPSPTSHTQTPTLTDTPQPTGTVGTPSATGTPTASPTCSGTWERVDSPSPNEIRSYLYDVEAIAADNIWAVGSYNTSFGLDDALILHWNGSAWSQVTGPGVLYSGLYAVSAIAPDDIWAVGYYNPDEAHPYQPLAIHWDGTNWTQVLTPGNPNFETTLQGVDAVSTNDVWAVGENENGQLIMHWDGTTWSIVSHPLQHAARKPEVSGNTKTGANRPDIYFDSLYAVEAVNVSDVWAVGSQSDHSLAMHWNGTQWNTVSAPNPFSTVILSGLDVISTNDIWAVGSSDFYMGQSKAVSIHWDGMSWGNVPVPGDGLVLTDVATFSPDDHWAVGYEQIDEYHTHELLMHRQGSSPWARVSDPNPPSPTLDELYGIAVSGPGEAWAVGLFDGATLVDRYTNTCGSPGPTATLTTTPTPILSATPAVCSISFIDIPPDSTFYTFIRCLACRGVVSGYPDGTFRPANNVTRGQITKIVSQAAGFQEAPQGQSFEDVQPGTTFYTYTERLKLHNVMSGYPCGTPPAGECIAPDNKPYFVPGNNATRGQLSKIVSNAAGYTEPAIGQYYADVDTSNPFYNEIMRLTTRQVMSGYTCGGTNPQTGQAEPCDGQSRPYFRWNNWVTRGQVTKIVANTFFPECQTQGGK